MTISEAIETLDNLLPNVYTQEEKINWLSQIDGIIKSNVFDTHEGGDDIEFNGYDNTTDTCTKLLVDAPYDEIYYLWMESRVNYANGELLKYNNSLTRYNDIYTTFYNWYNRTHMPLGGQMKF